MSETFALIKPDAYKHRKKIVQFILDAGFTIVAANDWIFEEDECDCFYSEHVGKDYYPRLKEHMMSGPCMGLRLRLEGANQNAIYFWRGLIGPTNPVEAKQNAPGSLRAQYGTELPMNALHGSDSKAAMICEASLVECYH
jgi:nucleoside diphosphate kinase